MRLFAVIPTHNRPDELLSLVTELTCQGVSGRDILVINNGGSMPLVLPADVDEIVDVVREPHIYHQWNCGLDWARQKAATEGTQSYAVAILNDDVELPRNFSQRMVETLLETDCTIAFPDQGPGIINRHGTHGNSQNVPQKRITGYAFVVNGTHGIRCDEDFRWWYGDDDLDWQARRDFNGTCEVSGVTVNHLYPSESTNASPERLEQAGRDRETFIRKWGKAPW